MKRVFECNVCGDVLAAATDEELVRQLKEHDAAEHPEREWDEQRVRETLAQEAYDAGDS